MTAPFPRAIIFDWDNTLVDSWGAIAETMNATLAHFGQPTWDIKTVRAKCTRAVRESFPEWFGNHWQEASDVFYKHYDLLQMQNLTPAFGSHDLLHWLQDQKVPLCVVSNKNGLRLRKEATALGWDKYFLSIVGAGDAPRDKPAREHADHALALAGLEGGKDVWFVGDGDVDMLCARNVGCLPVLIGTPEAAAKLKVDMFVADCEKLLGLLTEMQSAIGH